MTELLTQNAAIHAVQVTVVLAIRNAYSPIAVVSALLPAANLLHQLPFVVELRLFECSEGDQDDHVENKDDEKPRRVRSDRPISPFETRTNLTDERMSSFSGD